MRDSINAVVGRDRNGKLIRVTVRKGDLTDPDWTAAYRPRPPDAEAYAAALQANDMATMRAIKARHPLGALPNGSEVAEWLRRQLE